MWRNKIQISNIKNPPRQTASVWGLVWCHRHTDFFTPTPSPLGQKTSLINFKHKITTSANYMDGIGTGYISLTTNNCVCTVKDLKTTSKSINQIRCTVQGGGVKKR